MSSYSQYDAENDVAICNLTGLRGDNTSIVDVVIDELLDVLKTLDHKVFVLVCWTNATLLPPVVEHYGKRITEVRQYALGMVRYGASDLYTRTAIRTQTVVNSLGSSNQYQTKEEALDAVRRMRAAEGS